MQNKAEETLEQLKEEAKTLLNGLTGIPEGYSSDAVERLVDVLVMAGALQTVAWETDSIKEGKK